MELQNCFLKSPGGGYLSESSEEDRNVASKKGRHSSCAEWAS